MDELRCIREYLSMEIEQEMRAMERVKQYLLSKEEERDALNEQIDKHVAS